MQGETMSGRIDFSMGFNSSAVTNKRNLDRRYRIYILGDFSGGSDVCWEQRKIHRINSDSVDQVMSKIMPTANIDSSIQLQFETMDDFHPDAWLDKVKIIADLQVLKRQLSNPVTAAQAAAKIQALLPAASASQPKISNATEESQGEMFERLLGKKAEQPGQTKDTVDQLIQHMVAPFVSKSAEPQFQSLIEIIDQTLSQCTRVILHNSSFQRLEALWLATQALLNEESADEQQFFLVDISQTELAEQFDKDGQKFIQTLVQHIQASDEEPDVLLVADFSFSDTAEDRQLLAYCNDLAIACGGYFMAATDQVLADESLGADRIKLAYPRFLCRLPYGKKLDPIEKFAFEECENIPQPEELLWGCPAFIIARSLIRTSQPSSSPDALFFSDIPVFSFAKDGEQILQPGTETVLTESQANALLAAGIMPLIGYRQMRGIRVVGLPD
jgi:type VI secretion system protein ImpC